MPRNVRVIDGEDGSPLDKLLLEKFTSPYRKGYVECDGNILPISYMNVADDIENFEVRDSDVWVVSFQKAGTTWTQEMVWLLGEKLDFQRAKDVMILERFPFLELEIILDFHLVDWIPENVKKSVSNCAQLPGTRYIKTHLPWQLLPRQIRTGERKPKIVYVSRDPRDVVVSYYHHVRLMEGYRGTFDEFFDLFIADKIISTPYWPHVLGVWNERHRENVHFIKYEDMQSDLRAVAKKTAGFLGRSYSESELNDLLKHLSFESMKKNVSVNYEPLSGALCKMGLNTGSKEFMRNGKSGDFKAHLSEEQIRRMDDWSRERSKGSDYKMSVL